MAFLADLHVHSRYSRATSRDADLAGYYRWARVKGIRLVGTGDFTHPEWFTELSSQLIEEDGLLRLRDPPRGDPRWPAAPAADVPVRFVLTAEISSIYKKQGPHPQGPQPDHGRAVSGRSATASPLKLAAIGNIASDGRPILGLDPEGPAVHAPGDVT